MQDVLWKSCCVNVPQHLYLSIVGSSSVTLGNWLQKCIGDFFLLTNLKEQTYLLFLKYDFILIGVF